LTIINIIHDDRAQTIGELANLSLPFKSFNSITKTYPATTPSAFSTKSLAAHAVPPVANYYKYRIPNKSSQIKILSPF